MEQKKIYLLTIETCFDGDKKFKAYPHASLDGAKKHENNLIKIYNQYNKFEEIENTKNTRYFTDDISEDYIYTEIHIRTVGE